MNLLNKTAYNEVILTQEDTVCFQIIEEAKTKADNYGDARQWQMKFSRKFEPNTWASKSRPRKKFAKYKIDHVTRNPKE